MATHFQKSANRLKDLLRQVEDDGGQNPVLRIAAAQEVVAILIDQQRARWEASAQLHATGRVNGHQDLTS
jgi:hypothetical protein